MKIRNSKSETNSKSQFPNVQTLKVLVATVVLRFGHSILRILVIVSGFVFRIYSEPVRVGALD